MVTRLILFCVSGNFISSLYNFLFYQSSLMYSADATIFFEQSTYSIVEDGGLLTAILVLSNPSSFDITVEVTDTSNTATGKLYYEYCYNVIIFIIFYLMLFNRS